MKNLYTFLAAITLSFNLSAQTSSGTIVYETELKYNPNGEYAKYLEGADMSGTDMKSSYIVEFNERYVKAYSGETGITSESYWSITDKTSNQAVIALIKEENKTIRYIDPNPKIPEYDKYDYSDYGYYDEEEKAIDLENYHEDFYKDLLRMPPRDTVIYHTDETQEILGYTCKKVILKINGNGTTILWVTDQISGLEQLFKLDRSIKGTVVLMESTSEYFIIKSQMISFSPNNNLSTDNISMVPDGYKLDLGEVYLNSYETRESINSWFALPYLIEIQDAPEALSKVVDEIRKAITQNKKYSYGYETFNLKFTIDETGKVTSVELLENEGEYNYYDEEDYEREATAEIDMKTLNKNVKKNCSLQSPITVLGKSKGAILTLSYSYSYEKPYDYENYRD